MPDQLNKEEIVKLLNHDLPGREAHITMAPQVHRKLQPSDDYRKAGVMILLYNEGNRTKVVFIKRNEYSGPHSGQVSFPGGMHEDSDADLAQTAIRETIEETGVSNEIIEILGSLTALYIPVSNIYVKPYVGWATATPSFQPDRSEVQYLICPSIDKLFDSKNLKQGKFFTRHKDELIPYFDVSGEIIWGATAMMLAEFKALLGY